MRILITSDGSAAAHAAARFGGILAHAARADVTLLGVAGASQNGEALQAALTALGPLAEEIRAGGQCQVRVSVREGYSDEQIYAETNEHFYHLVVIGARGERKPGRFALGSTARRLTRFVKVPLLVGIQPGARIERVLLCTSGAKPGEIDAHVGGALAALVGAEVTILHVMPQGPSGGQPPEKDFGQDASGLIKQGSPEGEHLKKVIEIMVGQGLMSSHCHPKIRRGPVIDEVLTEIREGSYDMIVIGAHQFPEGLPFHQLRQLLQENIADRILTHARCPVLVVRALNPQDWVVSAGGAQSQLA